MPGVDLKNCLNSSSGDSATNTVVKKKIGRPRKDGEGGGVKLPPKPKRKPERYIKLHYCSDCSYVTYHSQNLVRHTSLFHTLLLCPLCKIKHSGKKSLVKHMHDFHGIKENKDSGGKKVKNSKKVSRKSSGKLAVASCDASCDTIAQGDVGTQPHSQIPPVCDASEQLLQTEEALISSDLPSLEETGQLQQALPLLDSDFQQEWLCSYCPMKFRGGVDLVNEHVQSVHGQEQPPPLAIDDSFASAGTAAPALDSTTNAESSLTTADCDISNDLTAFIDQRFNYEDFQAIMEEAFSHVTMSFDNHHNYSSRRDVPKPKCLALQVHENLAPWERWNR